MNDNQWKRKARKLAALAEDERGKPEGDLARQKLLEIINRHPEAAGYAPIVKLVARDITLDAVAQMHDDGVSTDDEWTAEDLLAATKVMEAGVRARAENKRRKQLVAQGILTLPPS